MIVVIATLRNMEDEQMTMQVHQVINEETISQLPLSDDEETTIVIEIEKEYPNYIVESIDSLTWTNK